MIQTWLEGEKKPQPLCGGRWVRVTARIRNNATGEVREYGTDEILEGGEETPSEWPWSDGNYGCDCNRRLFFARACGEEEDWKGECSDDKFSVQLVNPSSGAAYYDEMTPNV